MKITDAAAQLEALVSDPAENLPDARAGRGAGLPVGKFQARLAIPASTLSHHLKALIWSASSARNAMPQR